jgi:hypothetical protein
MSAKLTLGTNNALFQAWPEPEMWSKIISQDLGLKRFSSPSTFPIRSMSLDVPPMRKDIKSSAGVWAYALFVHRTDYVRPEPAFPLWNLP